MTPPGTARRERPALRPARQQFLDSGARSEVCPRPLFVGRRRALQRCLRVLRSQPSEEVYREGVLLHGLGGIGKSSLAARLCERLSGCGRWVWVGRVDEVQLLQGLANHLETPEAIVVLNEARLPLRQRLRRLLTEFLAERPVLFVFVFDDFEQNVEKGPEGGPGSTRRAGRSSRPRRSPCSRTSSARSANRPLRAAWSSPAATASPSPVRRGSTPKPWRACAAPIS